jgi:class 3 adenylate cyclase/tetratricopeptide (TPR) repeat protein
MVPLEVGSLLASIGLGQLADVFRANDIDGEVLPSLVEADLRELGLTLGQRKKVLAALERLRASSADASAERPEFEHRRVSVLFCDLIGSVGLAERLPPESVADVIQFYYRIATRVCRRFGGYIASLQGDGVVVIFGYPRATGAHAERAIRSGLELAARLAEQEYRLPDGTTIPIRARIGIASGRIVVGLGQADIARDSVMMFGSVPNKAARIQAHAAPGTLVVDDVTRSQAPWQFDFDPLPEAELKGIEGRVKLHRVRGPRRSAPAVGAVQAAVAPLIGRDAEVDILARAWAAAAQGMPQFAVITGEAGLGKTRLLGAITARAAVEGARTLRLGCGPLFSSQALHPVAQALQDEIGRDADVSAAARLDALRRELPDASAMQIRAVSGLLDPSAYPGEVGTGPETRSALLAALSHWLVGRPDKPTLIALEDAHWADPTTRELLGQLGEVRHGRFAVIVTTRPHAEPLWTTHPRLTSIALGPLVEDAAAQLLGRVLSGRAVPQAIRRRLLEHASGNPLMLEELAKASEHWGEEAPRGDPEVPTSIYDSIAARLDQLASGRSVAEMLAVFGTPVPPEAICAALGYTPNELAQLIDGLRAEAILASAADGDGSAVQFRHMLYRDVVYERLVTAKRSELHQTAAAVLRELDPGMAERQPDILAHHFFHAQDFPAAAPLALAAGERAAGSSAVIEAGAHFSMALDALRRMPANTDIRRLRLRGLSGMAAVKRALFGIAHEEVGTLSGEVHRIALELGDTETALLALNGLYTHALVGADYPAAGQYAQALTEAAQAAGHATFEMIGIRASGAVALHTGRFQPATELLQAALARYNVDRHLRLAHAHGYDHAEICAVFLAFAHWMRGDLAAARRVSAFSVSHSRQIRHVHSLAQALAFQAMLGFLARDPEKLGVSGLEARALGEAHGLKQIAGFGLFWRHATNLLDRAGSPHTGDMEGLAEAFTAFSTVSRHNYGCICQLAFAEGFLRQGEIGEASRHLDRALAEETRTGETWTRAERLRLCAQLLAARGEVAVVEDALVVAHDEAVKSNANTLALRIACDIAERVQTPLARRRLEEAAARMVSLDGGWDEQRLRRLA